MSISKDCTVVEKATELFYRFPDEIPHIIEHLKMHCYMVLFHQEELKTLCMPVQINRLHLLVLSAQRTLETLKQHGDTIEEDIELFAFSLFDWLFVDFVVNFLKNYGESEANNIQLTAFISEYFN